MSDRRKTHTIFDAISLSVGDGIMQADGSIWSHAATLGTRVKGTEFTIDRGTVENFVSVFATGYPQKVPVDYEHASTTDDPEVRKLRAQGAVPKAGDVLEMQGVFAASDFTGALKTAAEKLCAQATPARSLDDARNYGLWIRWKPTARALSAIQAREYTELSITFDDDWPHNTSGDGQGPTIIAVALTNLPFLDDMLPVAASRRSDDRDPADPGSSTALRRERMTQKLTMLSVVAALLGKAVTTDEEALTELNGLQPQFAALREYRNVISAEIGGETDPATAAVKIRELKSAADSAKLEAEQQKKTAIKTTVENTVKQYEKSLTVPLREMMVRQLTGELEAGKKLEETDTLKTLKSLSPLNIVGQRAGADANANAGVASELDEEIAARAKELMETDKTIKALEARSGFSVAYRRALKMVEQELAAK